MSGNSDKMEANAIDFGELSQDENFKQRLLSFKKDVESAADMMETFFARYNYDELSGEDKVRYNLFLAFAVNSYFWMYLRIRGIDPNEHEIKGQINRVREYMNRSKKLYERKTIMPRIDQGAAKRFVRSGLWTPQNLKAEMSSAGPEADSDSEVPAKRKRNNTDDS